MLSSGTYAACDFSRKFFSIIYKQNKNIQGYTTVPLKNL